MPRLRDYTSLSLLALLALGAAGCAAPGVIPAPGPAPSAPPPEVTAHEPTRTTAEPPALRLDERQAVLLRLQEARETWEGTPYRFGGTSRDGVDCSGFVQRVFAEHLDMRLTRATETQVREGHELDPHELQAGDLVFFRTGKRQRHVGIYLDNGRFLHASTSRGVTVDRLSSGFYDRTFWTARRVLTPERLARLIETTSPPPAPLVAESPRAHEAPQRVPPPSRPASAQSPEREQSPPARRSGW